MSGAAIAVIVAAIVANLAAAMFGGWLAGTKGRSDAAWFVLCLVFGIVALIAIAGAVPIEEEQRRLKIRRDQFNAPPYGSDLGIPYALRQKRD